VTLRGFAFAGSSGKALPLFVFAAFPLHFLLCSIIKTVIKTGAYK